MSSVILSWKFGWHNEGSHVTVSVKTSVPLKNHTNLKSITKKKLDTHDADTMTCKKEIGKAFLGFGLLKLN